MSVEESRAFGCLYHQNAGQNHNLIRAGKTFENVSNFKYFGMTVTDQKCFHEGIKSGLNFAKC
jgi:hypothetical protein